MRVTTLVLVLVAVWAVSAFWSGRLAARKNRGVKRSVILGLVLGPLVLLVHACYPARYKPPKPPPAPSAASCSPSARSPVIIVSTASPRWTS